MMPSARCTVSNGKSADSVILLYAIAISRLISCPQRHRDQHDARHSARQRGSVIERQGAARRRYGR